MLLKRLCEIQFIAAEEEQSESYWLKHVCAFVFELSIQLTGKRTFVISFVKKNVWNGSWASLEPDFEGSSKEI